MMKPGDKLRIVGTETYIGRASLQRLSAEPQAIEWEGQITAVGEDHVRSWGSYRVPWKRHYPVEI